MPDTVTRPISAGGALDPLAVGLVGAGPWARMVHAPLLAAGPETRLAGVWARRPEAAAELAAGHGAVACADFDALLDACEAVAFAVPPAVQATLAPTAAAAGKALLLEKPLADDVRGAQRVVEAVAEAGVGSVVVLTYRFAAATRSFLAEARAAAPLGGRGCFISGAFLGGPFAASPWRQERGALLDLGPHVVDLLDAALGPVVPGSVRAHGHTRRWVGLLLDHEGGATSEVSMSADVAIEPSRTEVSVYGPQGAVDLDARAVNRADTFATLRSEFAATARAGGGHVCDAARALHLQQVLAEAEAALAGG